MRCKLSPIRCLRLQTIALILFVGCTSGVDSTTFVFGNDLEKLQEIITDEASKDEIPIDEYDREHWAYQPLIRPAVPNFTDDNLNQAVADWPSNAIDAFLLKQMLGAGLQPAPPTDRVTLIRRLSFDLTGLPPSLDEVDRFTEDRRPNAYERLVDRMLATPEYGQRWAQHWLDLARFAETDGYEHDKIRETAWQFRDWVIQSLNEDMPYDRFVSLQIAGDLIAPDDPSAKIATAFCLSGPDMPDINSQEERKHVLLNDITSTVGSVFLSLQVGCAQCHDHKYDAISQADFYRLRAFFEPAVALKKNVSVTTLGKTSMEEPSRLYGRGDWRRPEQVVEAAFPRIANLNASAVQKGSLPQEQRAALASWLADESNPLVARSIVNRLWQFHFGRGLSDTPSDFGLVGQEPTHPELLDFLASRLIEGEWSLKRLHREILRSSFYQMTSRSIGSEQMRSNWKKSLELDPENRLWSRFPRRRLDAESIRDAMLAVSGLLNPVTQGPGVRPPLPSELVKTLKSGQWKVSENESDHYRRSIYIFARRNLTYPLFATFDRPAANCTCAERVPSTTPLQSLSLLNSAFTEKVVTQLAKSMRDSGGDTAKTDRLLRSRADQIYRRVYQREPSGSEHSVMDSLVKDLRSVTDANDAEDLAVRFVVLLTRASINSNGFLFVD